MKNNKLWLWVLAVAMTISLLFAVFAITTHAISGGSITIYSNDGSQVFFSQADNLLDTLAVTETGAVLDYYSYMFPEMTDTYTFTYSGSSFAGFATSPNAQTAEYTVGNTYSSFGNSVSLYVVENSSSSDSTVLYTPDSAFTYYAIVPRVTISGSDVSYEYYVIWSKHAISYLRTDYGLSDVELKYIDASSFAYCLFDTFEDAVSGIQSSDTVYSTGSSVYFIQGTSMVGKSYTIDWSNYYSNAQLNVVYSVSKSNVMWDDYSSTNKSVKQIDSNEIIKVIGEEEEEYCEITVTYPYSDDLMGTPVDSVSVLVGSFWNLTSTGICNEAGEYIYQWEIPCTHWTITPVSEVYSTVTPNGVLPSDFTASSDVHLYFYNYVPVVLSTPVISISDGVISWPEIPNATGYQLKINGDVQSGQIAGNSWNAYNNIDDIGSYSISVRALALIGGEFYYSAWSNVLSYEAIAPVINRFEIVDKTLYYDFGGTLAVGTLYRSGASISDDISIGAYNLDLTNIPDGLYSFRLTVTNKYGTISSGTIDYFVGLANDTYGTFYSIGVIMEQIVDLLKDVQFFGISLWMLLCTSFIITLIIPFLCIIVLPSRGVNGYSPRGGNDEKPRFTPYQESQLRYYNEHPEAFEEELNKRGKK